MKDLYNINYYADGKKYTNTGMKEVLKDEYMSDEL